MRVTEHRLVFKGGQRGYGIGATCTCGAWSFWRNVGLRGGRTAARISAKEEFQIHKGGQK